MQWEDLILPEPQKKLLADACDQVLLHHQVYHRWGFDKKLAYGKGVSMIFYGPPGTGKTMGAQVIANRLQMELYKVDMSGVLSKYVGESEKKLGNIFEQAKKSQSILFFDEADVLFGKRTGQKDSNDNHSKAGTTYLLQKIEKSKKYVLSEGEERLLAMAAEVTDGYHDVFSMLDNADLNLPEATFEGKTEKITHGGYGVALRKGNATERKEWFEKYCALFIF